MPQVPSALARELDSNARVVKSYFTSEDLKFLVEQDSAPYSYSAVYRIIQDKMWSLVLEIGKE